MEEERTRNTVARGELVKVNLMHCKTCPRVYVPLFQATKVSGVAPGWYEDLPSASSAFNLDPKYDPVVRVNGSKICPSCRKK